MQTRLQAMEEYERLASAFPKVPPFLEVQAALRSGFHVFPLRGRVPDPDRIPDLDRIRN